MGRLGITWEVHENVIKADTPFPRSLPLLSRSFTSLLWPCTLAPVQLESSPVSGDHEAISRRRRRRRRWQRQLSVVVQLVQVVGITGKVNNYAQLNARSEMWHAHALWAKRVTLCPLSPPCPLIRPAVAIAPVAPIGRQRVKVYALCCIHMAFLQRARRVVWHSRSAAHCNFLLSQLQ